MTISSAFKRVGTAFAVAGLVAVAVAVPSAAFAAEGDVDPNAATTSVEAVATPEVVAETPTPVIQPDPAAAAAVDEAAASGTDEGAGDTSGEDASASDSAVVDQTVVTDAVTDTASATTDTAAAGSEETSVSDVPATDAAVIAPSSTPTTVAPQATAPQPVETVLSVDIICIDSSPNLKVTTQSVVPAGQPLAFVKGTVVNGGVFYPFEGNADESGYFEYSQPVVIGDVDTIVNVNGSYAGDELNVVTAQTCAPEVKTIAASGIVRQSETTDSEIVYNTAVYEAQDCVEYYDLATGDAIASGFAFTSDSSFGARSTCGEFVIVTGGPWPFEYVKFSKIVQGATTTDVDCDSDPKTAVDSYLETEWVREAIKGELTEFKPGTTKVISNERPATAAELAEECPVVIPPGEDPDDHEPTDPTPVTPPVIVPVDLDTPVSLTTKFVAVTPTSKALAATGSGDISWVPFASTGGIGGMVVGLVLLVWVLVRRRRAGAAS